MSDIVIRVDGVDRTSDCIPGECNFELSMNAEPGTFSIALRDPNQVMSFTTGKEISLEIDGTRLFGGYVLMIGMGHFVDYDYIGTLPSYPKRKWVLQGVDYNIIFDKRVVRNTSNYLSRINLTDQTDGALLRRIVNNYADMDDFSTTGIEDIADIDGDVIEQASKIRRYFEKYQLHGGATWYVDPHKNIIWVPYESLEKRWGFSDTPNKLPITTSPAEFQGSTIGFRSVDALEDGTTIVNDALIWGGSEWAGTAGGIVFARVQDEDSQDLHNRWQLAETHFGDAKFKIQDQVDARANVIINGPPGTDVFGQQKGLRYPQWQVSFTWFSDDVPMLAGERDHIRPGDLVTIDLAVFDVTKLLPLRSLRISFPPAFEEANAFEDHLVQFDGTFGLNANDPFTLWKYLLGRGTPEVIRQQGILTVNNDSTDATLGSFYADRPSPLPDSVETTFTIPFGYIPGTLELYLNGLQQRRDTDFEEADFETGVITTVSPPQTEDNLWVTARTQPS